MNISAITNITKGNPGSEVITDKQENTCYEMKLPSEGQKYTEHFTLNVNHQGKTHIQLAVLGMASQITQCSMMNVFYSAASTPNECNIKKLCSIEDNNPTLHYANNDLVTCKFNCACVASANQCKVHSFTFDGKQENPWQLCELVIA